MMDLKHIRRVAVLFAAILVAAGTLSAQKTAAKQQKKASVSQKSAKSAKTDTGFDDFMSELYGDYDEFVNTLLEEYATFLSNPWVDMKSDKPAERYTEPKPLTAPTYDPNSVLAQPEEVPVAQIAFSEASEVYDAEIDEVTTNFLSLYKLSPKYIYNKVKERGSRFTKKFGKKNKDKKKKDKKKDKEQAAETTPQTQEKESPVADTPAQPKPETPAMPQKPVAQTPAPAVEDIDPEDLITVVPDGHDDGKWFDFTFYGMPVRVPDYEYDILASVNSPADYGYQFRQLQEGKIAEHVVPGLTEVACRMGLNDYFIYRLMSEYICARFPDKSKSSKVSLLHNLLCNMGYDAQVCQDASTNEAYIMLQSPQQLYHCYIQPHNQDKKYYIFDLEDEGKQFTQSAWRIPNVPSTGVPVKPIDFRVQPLNIPYEPYEYSFNYKGLGIKGELNANVIPMLKYYPQMQMGYYAVSNVLPDVRNDVVAQFKQQVSNLEDIDAVNSLLSFMHGLPYESDQTFHGYEKPYFFEETLFYPKCDCEDRAIFYTYLLWNVLGHDNMLIQYPGHESAGVAINSQVPRGKAFSLKGKRYYESDPTYIGSHTGMCGPDFQRIQPTVDYNYTHNE